MRLNPKYSSSKSVPKLTESALVPQGALSNLVPEAAPSTSSALQQESLSVLATQEAFAAAGNLLCLLVLVSPSLQKSDPLLLMSHPPLILPLVPQLPASGADRSFVPSQGKPAMMVVIPPLD